MLFNIRVYLRTVGEKILKSLTECPVFYNGEALHVTSSIGIATWQAGSFDETVSIYQNPTPGE